MSMLQFSRSTSLQPQSARRLRIPSLAVVLLSLSACAISMGPTRIEPEDKVWKIVEESVDRARIIPSEIKYPENRLYSNNIRDLLRIWIEGISSSAETIKKELQRQDFVCDGTDPSSELCIYEKKFPRWPYGLRTNEMHYYHNVGIVVKLQASRSDVPVSSIDVIYYVDLKTGLSVR
jgi:hypothetical protein